MIGGENDLQRFINMLETISKKYNYNFSDFFKKLWNDGQIDWYKGWDEPWSEERNWFTEVYPTIKNNPPVLLHTGSDFEMLSEKEMLHYEFCEWWDTKHKFVPFGQTGAGDLYAFYQNIEIEGEHPIVLVWHDCNETQILSKNLEDFIFRMMMEKIVNITEDDSESLYYQGNRDALRKALLADLETAKKYLNSKYIDILDEVYNRPFEDIENIISVEELKKVFAATIHFDLMDTKFEHEEPYVG